MNDAGSRIDVENETRPMDKILFDLLGHERGSMRR